MLGIKLRIVFGALILGWTSLTLGDAAEKAGIANVSFSATDTDGKTYAAIESQAKATVWIFISHDCPISNSYAPEIVRVQKKYSALNVSFRLVYAEPGLSLAALRAHATERGYSAPIFADGTLTLARACGATATPEVAVLDARGKPVYRGRIDDRFWAPGRERTHANRQDLREALDDVLANRVVRLAQTTPIGCYLAEP